jgi:hypothetical protein
LSQYRDAILLDTLAAAYAASGRYPEALSISARELELANAKGDGALADRVRQRMDAYRDRQDKPAGTGNRK